MVHDALITQQNSKHVRSQLRHNFVGISQQVFTIDTQTLLLFFSRPSALQDTIALLHFHLLVWLLSTPRLYQHISTVFFLTKPSVVYFSWMQRKQDFFISSGHKKAFFVLQWCLFNGVQVWSSAAAKVLRACFCTRLLTVPSLCVSLNLKTSFPFIPFLLCCFMKSRKKKLFKGASFNHKNIY